MSVGVEYQHLESRPGSNYRQFFVKGRRIRAEVVYRCTVGPEGRPPFVPEVRADREPLALIRMKSG